MRVITAIIFILAFSYHVYAEEKLQPQESVVSESVAIQNPDSEPTCPDHKTWACKTPGERVALVVAVPIVLPFFVVIEAGKIFFDVFGTGGGDLINYWRR